MAAIDFSMMFSGIIWTISLTLCSFVLGAVLGLPLCAMKTTKLAPLNWLATLIILISRSIPPVLWLFIIFFGVGSDLIALPPFLAACLGLGLITAANMAEIYRGALTAIHAGQFEAAKVLNLTRYQQFVDVILPQMFRIALPSAAGYMIGLLKDSAVASTIGVPEIAFQAYHTSQQTFQGLSVYASAALLYIAMSLPIAYLARRADHYLRAKVAQ